MSIANKNIKATRVRRAFTLVEALLASTLLAIVAASATLPFSAGAQNTAEAQKMEQAVELGTSMMEEVLARSFFEPGQSSPTPGPEAGEDVRLQYDSIDDFAGYSESDKVIRNFKNAPVTDSSMTGFWRDVAVTYVSFPNQQPGDTNSIAHVRVRVYHENVLMVTLDRLVSRED